MRQERQQRYLLNMRTKKPNNPTRRQVAKANHLHKLSNNTGSKRRNTRNRTIMQSTSIPLFEDWAEAVVRKSVGGNDRILHVVREIVRYGKPSHHLKAGDTVDYIKYFSYNKDTMTYTYYRAYLGHTGGQYGVNAIHDVTNNKWIPVVGNDELVKAMEAYFRELSEDPSVAKF